MKPKRRNMLPWLKSRLRRLQAVKCPTGRQLDRMDDLIFEIRKLEPQRPRRRVSPLLAVLAVAAATSASFRR